MKLNQEAINSRQQNVENIFAGGNNKIYHSDKKDGFYDKLNKMLDFIEEEVEKQAGKGFFKIKIKLDLDLNKVSDLEVYKYLEEIFKSKGENSVISQDKETQEIFITITLDLPERLKDKK